MNAMNLLAPINGNVNVVGDKSTRFKAFDPEVLRFVEALSQALFKHEDAKKHPELVALGFWLRQSNLQKMQKNVPSGIVKPLGWVMHFTPANVDTMFIYSWICSLLMGNHNVIRVATQTSELKDCLLKIINGLYTLAEFSLVGQRNLFISYDKDSDYSAKLSIVADARVIWGGDQSVSTIRALASKPRCRDISFADRYSVCVVNGDVLTDIIQQQQLASRLYKDSQPFEQQACSSPRILFWLGAETSLVPFLEKLNELHVETQQSVTRINNHLVFTQLVKSQADDVIALISDKITALRVTALTKEQLHWHSGEGLYLIKPIKQLEDICQHADEKLQTLSYWGLQKDELIKLLASESISGIDRILPVGQALDFSPVWDGFDIFNQLCRRIVVE